MHNCIINMSIVSWLTGLYNINSLCCCLCMGHPFVHNIMIPDLSPITLHIYYHRCCFWYCGVSSSGYRGSPLSMQQVIIWLLFGALMFIYLDILWFPFSMFMSDSTASDLTVVFDLNSLFKLTWLEWDQMLWPWMLYLTRLLYLTWTDKTECFGINCCIWLNCYF